jgi:hypothetical protein
MSIGRCALTPLDPFEFLASAERLLTQPGRPSQEDLSICVDALYKAMFRVMATAVADSAVGEDHIGSEEWVLAYRGLEHLHLRSARDWFVASLPASDPARQFIELAVELQAKRSDAAYDPFPALTRSQVLEDLNQARLRIVGFAALPLAQRRQLVARVLFRRR